MWAGQTVSTVGSTIGALGAAVWVYADTGSATWLGVLLALAAAPAVIGALAAGVIDRVDRRTVMLAADAVAAVGPLLALTLALVGELEPWHLAVAAFVGGLGTALQVPAAQAAVPALVAPEALGRANGLMQLGPAAGLVIGPLVATPLVATLGIEAVLVVDLASFAVGFAATAVTPFRAVAEPVERDRDGVAAGLDWLRATGRPLLVLVVVLACTNLVLAFFNVAVIAAATDLGGTARAGLVPAVGGLAMIVASVGMGTRGVPQRRVRAMAAALALFGVGSLVAAGPSLGWLLVGVPIALVAVPVANATVATLFHERVPADLQGRVFAIRAAIGRVLDPAGSLLAGLVLARIATGGSTRPTSVLLAGVAVALVAIAVVVVSNRSIRRLDDELLVTTAREAAVA